jgi:hypothetical protein
MGLYPPFGNIIFVLPIMVWVGLRWVGMGWVFRIDVEMIMMELSVFM